MSKDQNNAVANVLFALFGITAVSLFLGLHRFLWRLWIVLSGLWVGLVLIAGQEEPGFLKHPRILFVLLGPPLLLLGVVMLLAWIINGLRTE